MAKRTVMSFWQETISREYSVNSIQEAIEKFKSFTIKQKDRFCGILVDNLDQISDVNNAQSFMRLRLNSLVIK